MSCTDTTKLKSEFESQLKDANEKIAKAKTELSRLEEYRTKLVGGLETLALLDQQEESSDAPEEAPISPEATALQ